MQHFVVVILLASSALIGIASAENYLWGEIGPKDYLLAQDKVKHAFFVGIKVTETYTFKQKNDYNALTITAIKVTDQKNKNGSTCILKSGGPGSKGATLYFTSATGHSIKSVVEIYGR